MKGVILAGGLGSRLHPCTKITNKHLLPVYDRPMIYYPIQTLINAGIDDFADGGRLCVVLGDNIIEKSIAGAATAYRAQERGARILLKEVDDPERFGVPVMEGERIIRIEEKPRQPMSRYAVTGIYFYDNLVFDMIQELEPSARGELEISDVNNMYLERDLLEWSMLDGWWSDAGTFSSLLRASNLIAQGGANQV
jgi:glucose-1-phosphate thymidylyltransferase